jgi:endoglucanase
LSIKEFKSAFTLQHNYYPLNMRKIMFFVCLLAGILPNLIKAATIVEVVPIHNRMLMVHFDDGFVVYHQIGQKRDNERAVVNPLSIVQASLVGAYTLQSSDDANYSTGQRPTQVGRKTKATEFTWLCQSWNNGCTNTSPDHAKEHWIYLTLPTDMVNGRTYTLNTGSLGTNASTWTFTFDENKIRSEGIHVNQVGYHPAAAQKYGYLYHWAGDLGGIDFSAWNGRPFQLVTANSGEVVFNGTVAFRLNKNNQETGQPNDTPNRNFAGADVWECNFSSFDTPGEYRLVIPGVGCSFPFTIGNNAYNPAFYAAIRSLYHNRSGIALQAPYTTFTRPAPHRSGVTPGFANKLKYSTFRTFDLGTYDGTTGDKAAIEARAKGTLTNTWGWYQDAGDWDGYYTHAQIPAWLLVLLESDPQRCPDGALNIPESGNGLPDLLDEARWLPAYFQRARKEITDKGWGTGGVPGARVFGDLWGEDAPGGVGAGSWQDTQRDWYVLGEDPWMTYKYAGIAAHLAWIYQSNNWQDPSGIDWRTEAINAWNWAKNNTLPGDLTKNLDFPLRHVRMYAAAQLLRLTGESAYNDQFVADAPVSWPTGNGSLSADDLQLAAFTYANLPDNLVNSTQKSTAIRLLTLGADEELLLTARRRACRWGGNFFFPMLVGQATTPIIGSGALGYLLYRKTEPSKANGYLDAMRTTADYFLGNNPLNMCWITGVGDRSPAAVFHLDWWYSGKTEVLPGVTPYGPWLNGDYGPLGPWNHMWANQFVYPVIDRWPGHERWFSQRTSPLAAEFTVHQNTRLTAMIYGLLSESLSSVSAPDLKTAPKLPVTAFFNPDDSTITLQNPEQINLKMMEVFSIDGQLIKTAMLQGKDNIQKIQITAPVAGIYVTKVRTNDGRFVSLKLLLKGQ